MTCATLLRIMLMFCAAAVFGADSTRPVTFAKDIAPIFQEKCEGCHRAGSMAPMSLVTYQEVRPWVNRSASV